MSGSCVHNQRTRYACGYYCADCNTLFIEASPTYRKTELLSSMRMVLHNINAERLQNGLPAYEDVAQLVGKIGFFEDHTNYEELIAEAEVLISKYGKDSKSATLILV